MKSNTSKPLLTPATASLNSGYGSSNESTIAIKTPPAKKPSESANIKKSNKPAQLLNLALWIVGLISLGYSIYRYFPDRDESDAAAKDFNRVFIPDLNSTCISHYNTNSTKYPNQPLCIFINDNTLADACQEFIKTMCGEHFDLAQLLAGMLALFTLLPAIFRSMAEEEKLHVPTRDAVSVSALIQSKKLTLPSEKNKDEKNNNITQPFLNV